MPNLFCKAKELTNCQKKIPIRFKKGFTLAIGNTQIFQKWEITFGVGYIKVILAIRLVATLAPKWARFAIELPEQMFGVTE